ncbi:2-alkenal reductase (NADP(+)-dependent) isoform X2 [Ipomoea triloba]|uniref:2-alkenal reductase (NADP(+)-dependent) isoform X2 n=1 Tax=Ipomoea triloba TaxID=35885 RepID=UPI00125D5A4D|nr:2-alkenal reductase (NADP(+)-dependent) isoform X2 [Ipomoea triloba]
MSAAKSSGEMSEQEHDEAAVGENKQIIFKGYIDGVPKETDMEVVVGKRPDKLRGGDGGEAVMLVKNLYLSCDPYMRGRMRDFHGSYIPPFLPGSVIEGFGVSKVLASSHPDYKPGDLISGFTGWEEYSLIHRTEQLRKIQADNDIPLSYHIGLLVGQLVGQLAKLHGCYVVGSAGTKEKVDLLKDKLGFDDAFNYKEVTDFDSVLKRYFTEGIDIYFDNVGGAMLDVVLLNMRLHGRIAICGVVSQQTMTYPHYNLFNLITKRVRMKGFLQSDYLHLFPKFLEHVTSLYKQGKIVYIEDMNIGLESAPAAFAGLFYGKNVGKQVIRVAT